MSKNLLLEIGTEEMPAKIMSGLVEQLNQLANIEMKNARLSFDDVKVYATPRRLAVIIEKSSEIQSDENLRKRGPSIKAAFDKEGNPTRALQGFAKSQKVDIEKIEKEGEYTWANITNKGKKIQEVLPVIFKNLISNLNFSRSMNWGTEKERFIRPIRWLVAMCDEEIIPVEFAHVKSGNISRGHRFLASDHVEIKNAESYKETMKKSFVIVDQDERRQMIIEGLKKVSEKLNGILWENKGLLEEINYLVEYPTALYGKIDEKFLQLPVPAVVTPMRDHQRYYPLRNKNGKLMPYFLTVRNGGTQSLENVKVGNERVLRARLEDAQFFFDEDRKKSLENFRENLKRINYQEGMGTMLDKANRLSALTELFAKEWKLSDEEAKDLKRASYLSKSDLATHMVTEFTELQGEMGKEYALLDNEKETVANAIFEQYLPRFSGDVLPKSNIGRALSLADKLDNLTATFLRGLIPTGSQDPFALRRQTIGIVNILNDGKIHWDITSGIKKALDLLSDDEKQKNKVLLQILEFIRQRVKVIMSDLKIDYDIVDAVSDDMTDIYAVFRKANAVIEMNVKEEIELRQVVTRLSHITKDKNPVKIEESLFEANEEKELYKAYIEIADKLKAECEAHEYIKMFEPLKNLVKYINAFLDSVMVMVENEDVKNNRISLLIEVLNLYKMWGDFSKLV